MKNNDFWRKHLKQNAVLSPVDRISEVLFGLIMVLTFTGAISVGADHRDDVKALLWAAIGCNLAWGLVDAIMYLMNVALERGHAIAVFKKLHGTNDPGKVAEILREEIQPAVAVLMNPDELNELAKRLKALPKPEKRNLFNLNDLKAGVQIFFLVFLCTIPVAMPFALLTELQTAMRVSNGLALFLLAIGGYILAGYAGFNRILTSAAYALIGVLLVGLTMALGG